jgi:hypothetical protein
VIVGLYIAGMYSITAAKVSPQPAKWPAQAQVRLANDRPTMLLTLHPQCACSHATIEELKRLLAQAPNPIYVEILLYQPDKVSGWEQTSLARSARSIPGVVVKLDPNGAESLRFGMSVSGHAVVYAPDGRLLFSGGITRARGHAGDNAGRSAIVSLLAGARPRSSHTPVFGCSIRGQS